MDAIALVKTLSFIMKAKEGYAKFHEGNLEPRINAAADKTAESYDNLHGNDFYAAMYSDQLEEFTEEFRPPNQKLPNERFADILRDVVADPNLEVDFEAASNEFFKNLEHDITNNDKKLWRHLVLIKQEAIREEMEEMQKSTNDDFLAADVSEILEPLDSVYSHFTSGIDEELLEPVRVIDTLDKTQAESIFENTVKQKIWEETGMKFERFQRELESDQLIFIETESIEPDLTIQISEGFDEIEFNIPPGNLTNRLNIERPNLLWECSCQFSARADCKIHSNEIGKRLSKKFGRGYVKISYQETDVIWKDSQYFWPPSVDTIYMIENLLGEGIHKESTESICEIGCGTGLMGIVLASMSEGISELYMTDWLITPLVFSRVNWEINKERIAERIGSNVSFTPILGYGSYWVGHPPPREISIEQAYCNPPYLPALEEFESVQEQHTVGGTALLELLIEDGGEFADSIFINFSNIALPEAKESESRSSASLEQIGSTHTVPFRVPPALANPSYMKHLIKDRNLEIREDDSFPFWHDVSTYRLDFK